MVEFGARLMRAAGGRGRRRGAEAAHRGPRASRVRTEHGHQPDAPHGRTGHVAAHGLRATASRLDVDVVGVRRRRAPPRRARPRGRPATVGERGGVVVDDACRTARPARLGRSARSPASSGRCLGLVAPGYTMAEVVVDRLLGGDGDVPRRRPVDQAQALGVDVASFGDAFATTPGRARGRLRRPGRRRLQEARAVRRRADPAAAASSSGDASAYAALRPMVGRELGRRPRAHTCCREGGGAACRRRLPDEAAVCSCNNVTAGAIRCAVTEAGCTDVAGVKACTRAGTSCGSCLPAGQEAGRPPNWSSSGVEVSTALCEHFALSRAQLFDAVRVSGPARRSARSSAGSARGRGCDICKPVVALDPGHPRHRPHPRRRAGDAAGHQRPRDGEPAEGRHLLGGAAHPGRRDHPRGADRRSARSPGTSGCTRRSPAASASTCSAPASSSCPTIWRRLVDAGFESGHAYGKSLRTVKSCVGSTWCRYGVQDSVGMAVAAGAALPRPALAAQAQARRLRLRPRVRRGARQGRGRHRHRARAGTSTSAATAASTPRHAKLLAEDLDDRGARAQRSTGSSCTTSAPPTGCSAPRRGSRSSRAASTASASVIIEDSLGICADLDAAMAAPRRATTRTSGRRRSRTRRSCGGSRRSSTPRARRPVAGLRRRARPGRDRRQPRGRDDRGVAHRRHDPGGAAMIRELDASTRTADLGATCARIERSRRERGARGTRRRPSRSPCSARSTAPCTRCSSAIPTAALTSCRAASSGTRGAAQTVASPMYKQVFDLRTGECLEPVGKDPVGLETFAVSVRDGVVLLGVRSRTGPP